MITVDLLPGTLLSSFFSALFVWEWETYAKGQSQDRRHDDLVPGPDQSRPLGYPSRTTRRLTGFLGFHKRDDRRTREHHELATRPGLSQSQSAAWNGDMDKELRQENRRPTSQWRK